MYYSQSQYSQLPSKPGVYEFLDKNNTLLYVGKSKSLKDRVSSYFLRSSDLGEKTKIMVSQVAKIRITIVESELESLLLEAFFIKKYQPKYNAKLTDGKAYVLIEITKLDEYPRVLVARKMTNPKSVYFGPFPNSSAVKSVLKISRKIFPFITTKHYGKFCLYYHLGLCPCPQIVGTLQAKLEYKKNIRTLIQFLFGNSKKVIKTLEKERDSASKKEDFELASKLQNQIQAIRYVTSSFHQPNEYVVNPNLREDIREKELQDLQTHLENAGITTNRLSRIECYDISNTSGKQATASMVVLTQGEIDKSEYRKFKISQDIVGPNDFAMMESVITRRLNHPEWKFPNLIVVDGGKGQITSALIALEKAHKNIPLVGLAKREETIITSGFKEISLPKNSPSLHLIMKLRDEAHRFAITYHRKLRTRSTFE